MCLSTSRARPQSGIYRGERLLEALMGRPFAAAGDGQAQPTLTVTAIRIMCLTMPRRVRQQSGISITMCTQAPRGAQLFVLAGAYSTHGVLHAAIWIPVASKGCSSRR